MLRFILHRFLLMIPTLIGVAVLVFFLLRLMPGDPVATMLLGDAGGANISKEVIEQERARLGLDRPMWVQFFKWFGGVLQGDFGVSMWTGRSVAYEIGPITSLIPNSVTIRRARSVAFSMSLLEPVVVSLKTMRSDTLPPSRPAILSSNSVFDWR